MQARRSLGGIGKLYSGDGLLGAVYYNIKRDQPADQVECTVVFVGRDIELADTNRLYRLYLEDGSYLVVRLQRTRTAPNLPYSCVSVDGVFYATLTHSY